METNTEKNNYVFKKANHDGIGFAVLLILAGGVFLLLNLDIIPAMYKPILISWQMLLVAIGVWSIFKRNYTSALILILVGLFFIYPELCVVLPAAVPCADFNVKTYWPLILIVVGVLLISSRSCHKKKWNNRCEGNYENDSFGKYDSASWDSADFIHKDMVFGGSEQIVLSQNFRGGEANVVFGELIIDLRKAALAQGTSRMEINAVFGSLVLYTPSDWVVEIKSSSVFGGVEDRRTQPVAVQQEGASKLMLEANAVFGSCEIRS